jgi:mRNA interferase RelE/StbE
LRKLRVAITFSRQALKSLMAMQPARRAQIVAALEQVHAAPRAPNNNLRPLAGMPRGYRLRVGDWRISFTLSAGTMDVFEIAPRGSAYRW